MKTIAAMLLPGAKIARNYFEQLVKDVPQEQFARLAPCNGKPLIANHAAFHTGHLCLYPAKVMTLLCGPVNDVTAPASYDALFAKGNECNDDSDGSLYPKKDELIAQFCSATDRVLAFLPEVPDAAFHADNPITAARDRFATAGQFASFLLHGHIMVHCGQLSTWRRVIGLGSVH